MMMHGMGGGIGGTMIMGWPLADWATILLLLIVSIMIVAFVSAILDVLKPRPDQTLYHNRPQEQAPQMPAHAETAHEPRMTVPTTEGMTRRHLSDHTELHHNKGTQDA